jgi:AcrR family transcriptional regulator
MPRSPTTPTLRERLDRTTRDHVLDALVDLLGETRGLAVSYFELARRAGISVRTIYRYFPDRDDLIDALSKRVTAVVGLREYPQTRDGVAAVVRALFPVFDRHASLIDAQIQVGLGGRLRAHARRKRVDAMQVALGAALPRLPAERRRAAAGVLNCLVSATTWQRLRDEVGLDGDAAGEITAWAIETLWRALEVEARDLKG